MDWYPLYNSLRIAAISTVAVFFLGILAAYYIAKLPRLVKGVLDVVLTLPLVLPPTVVGWLLLVLLGPNSPIGAWVQAHFGLYKAFDELGIGYAKTKVGDKYVYEYMMANGCRLGGEQSGHIIFSKYASTGDGILTSLKIMETMMAKKKTLSQLCEGFTFYPQVLKNVRVADKAAAQGDPDVQKAVAEVTAKLGDTGRILVRESGTEPVIRVMVEAESKDVCEQYVDSVIEVIRAKGHCV